MTAQKFEVGQRVWVSVRNRLESSKPFITEYVITSVSKLYISARPINQIYERKFHKRTLTNTAKIKCKYEYKLWAEVEDFWKAVEEGMYGGKS